MTDFNFKPKLGPEDFGWHRRNLPHLDADGLTQFMTFRLCDSLPEPLIEKWRTEGLEDAEFRRRIEGFLDRGHGQCWLKIPEVAGIVRDAFLYHEGSRFDLHSWVIMPNHGHLLLTPKANVHLPDLMHSIKSYTAQRANVILGRSGEFWQHESFDRYIRDWKHYNAVARYIENNPVKAGLCKEPGHWQWSSAYQAK